MAFLGNSAIKNNAVALLFNFSPFGQGEKTMIGEIVIEVQEGERLEMAYEIPDYPTEDGLHLNDSIQRKPQMLNITGIVGNAEVYPFSSLGVFGEDRQVQILQMLGDLSEKRETVSVTTPLQHRTQMAIESLTFSKNADGFLNISVDLKEIRKAYTTQTDAPESVAEKGGAGANNSASSTKSAGKKGTGANGRAGKTAKDMGKAQPKATTTAPRQSELRSLTSGIFGR